MKNLSETEVMKKIKYYFSKDKIDSKQTKKMKKLAMAYRINLKNYRKRFCKKCYSDLKTGKIRVSKNYKFISCGSCGLENRKIMK